MIILKQATHLKSILSRNIFKTKTHILKQFYLHNSKSIIRIIKEYFVDTYIYT
jgi:hypothetical protein